MNTIEGRLFGQLVAQVIQRLYVKDQIGDMQHHTIDYNISWSFSVCVHFHNTFTTPLLIISFSNNFQDLILQHFSP